MFDCALSLAIRLSAVTVIVGWLLSACGQLNGRGYLFLGLPIGLAVAVGTLRKGPMRITGRTLRRFWRWIKRCRVLPIIYFLTVGLIIAGSVLHEPNNFDGLSYREPKVLNWLDQHKWHWIDSPYEAINYTLPNYEWLTVPFFLATRGFHSTVVINWIAMLFLPSLVFTLMRAFGARGRAAFDWMWILPSGYIIVLEAGGIGNDLIGMVALLAGLHFANRFTREKKEGQLFDALLAAAFCTGVKLSNAPLAGFVLIILMQNMARVRARGGAAFMGLLLGAAISGLIPVIENFKHTGTIFGLTTKLDQIDNPLAGIAGNGLITVVTALQPSFLPGATKIMPALEHALGEKQLRWLQLHYGKFTLGLHELPQEEFGGLGLGITMMLLLSAALWLKARMAGKTSGPRAQLGLGQRCLWWVWFWFALFVTASKLGTGMPFSRNILPWYPLALVPLAAFFGNAPLGRSLLWRVAAPLAMLCVWPALFLNPSRPLIPAAIVLKAGDALKLSAAQQERMRLTYEVYANRADVFAPLRTDLPPETEVLGLVSDGSEPTASFWKPYFTHRCVYLTTDAQVRAAAKEGVEYFVVSEDSCVRFFKMHTDEFLVKYKARAVKPVDIRMLVGWPASRYTLAKFDALVKPKTAPH